MKKTKRFGALGDGAILDDEDSLALPVTTSYDRYKKGRSKQSDLRDLSESETRTPSSRATDMRTDDEKRRSSGGIAQMVQQMTAAVPGDAQGVGGRHGSGPSPARGGGYQDISGIFEFRTRAKKNADPRLDELAAMGMQNYWLEVAEYLGVDAFLGMWRILDTYKDSIPSKGSYATSLYPTLRNYASYLRFQKNRFVEALAAQGVAPKEIQRRVQTQLCENISIVHIQRLARKAKISR